MHDVFRDSAPHLQVWPCKKTGAHKKTPVSENENLYPMAKQAGEKRLRLANPH